MGTELTIKVIDDIGYVSLLEMLGDDRQPAKAARVSYGKEIDDPVKDKILIDYLARNRHGSPFEMVIFLFKIKLPIFVMRQLVRHRIASINEISGRYVEFPENEFYIPKSFRAQSSINKQGSNCIINYEELDKKYNLNSLNIHNVEEWNSYAQRELEEGYKFSYQKYQNLLKLGVAKELARSILPLGTYTEIYWCINFRSLMNFIKLRIDANAQWEIQEYARALLNIVEIKTPQLSEILRKEILIDSAVVEFRNNYYRAFKNSNLTCEERDQEINRISTIFTESIKDIEHTD